MTDSPSPIDSSFDASDVATPCTVIAAKCSIRNHNELDESEDDIENQDDYTESYPAQEEGSVEHEDLSHIYMDDLSKEFSECASSVMEPLPKPHTFARTMTKLYYHLDNEETPYIMDVHVPPDCITLRDVKRKLPKTNYKYYCIVVDPDTGHEVKKEVLDESQRLYPLKTGRFELFMSTIEGSVHSDTSSGRHRRKHGGSSKGSSSSREYRKTAHRYDNPSLFSDDDSHASSIPTYVKKADAFNRRQASQAYDRHQPRHLLHERRHQNHYEDSTFDITEESNDHYRNGVTYYDEDEDDSRSINTDLTSVSQVHQKQRWRELQQQREMKNKWKRKPSMSTASSSLSSITESSMGLEMVTVTLNLQSMPLGMSPYGLQTARGGDGGLYVGVIHDRGAVALDGRIDVGDMITEINHTDLSNYTSEEAARLLKDLVQRNQSITLTVAKSSNARKPVAPAFPRNPRAEPVRPIDPNEWVKHSNAMKGMPSISEESCSTPIPDDWPTKSSASGTSFGGPLLSLTQLTTETDKKLMVEVMAAPGSGLDIRDRKWCKLEVPMSFIGSHLVDWLFKHVQGFRKRKEAYKFAEEMLKLDYIKPDPYRKGFCERSTYVMGVECADYTRLRAPDGGFKSAQSQTSSASGHSNNNNVFPPSMYPSQMKPNQQSALGPHASHRNSAVLNSMVSGYASMPSSPFPNPKPSAVDFGRTRDDVRSQTSGSSQGSSRRYVELPRKPASLGSGSGISDSINVDRVASRSSFRAAMSGSLRHFNIDQ